MGVVLWYQIEFPDQKIKISSDVYSGAYLVDAAISIRYAIGLPVEFEVQLNNLPLPVSRAIEDGLGKGTGVSGGVEIIISLGYLDDLSSAKAVLTGRIESVQPTTAFPPLGLLLKGHEKASFLLLNTVAIYGEKPPPRLAHVSEPKQQNGQKISPAAIATLIVKAATGAPPAGTVTPQDSELANLNEHAEDAFHLLDNIARKFGAEILVQDEKVMFGQALVYPPDAGPMPATPNPTAIAALLTGDDSLITLSKIESARLAEFRPVQIGSTSRRRWRVTDLPPQADVKAFDFTALGLPSLRAGQLVVASVDGYQNPFSPFRILNVTHAFNYPSAEAGYTCTGRAVAFQRDSENRELSQLARRASAPVIADKITGKIRESQAVSPSVDVGKVKEATPADRAATLFYGQQPAGGVSSPSIDADVPEGESVLLSKPIAAPFAWHNVGLSVPVYQGMRALLNQVRDSRDDAVVTGFLWANEPKMNRPPAADGDWWLCLPTEVAGTPPKPIGAGANDLTAADGRRVIEAAGLSIAIGKAACTQVGKRPAEGPADVLLITHKTGTTIQVDGQGNVTVDGKGSQVVLKCGGATLTVGNGKVAIS